MGKTVKKIAMVMFKNFPLEPRTRREAVALAQAGFAVDVVCASSTKSQKNEKIEGINVFRVPLNRSRSGKFRYCWEYSCFILLAFLVLSRLYLIRRYDVIHVHNMPDVLIMTALIPILAGSKVILDLHDPVPEVYMTKYSVSEKNFIVRILIFLEQFSIKMADLVLTPNKAFRDRFIARGCPSSKIRIIMNSPQDDIFDNAKIIDKKADPNNFVIMFHGVINERSGLHIALEAIKLVRSEIPKLKFEVYGSGETQDKIKRYIENWELKDIVTMHGLKSLEEIAAAIHKIDVGIIPNIMSPFTNINLPTRIMECMSLGKPVIAPATKGILDYFDENSLFLFDPGNVESLSRAILDAFRNPLKCREIAQHAGEKYMDYRWELQKKRLVKAVSELIGT